MRWMPFAIVAIMILICQTTIVQVMAIQSVRPNWMFVLAIYYALWGAWPDAAIAAWLLGLAVDLTSLGNGGRLGLYAFSFGAAAWAIIKIRSVFFRDHAVTQFAVTLVFSLAVELVVQGYRHWSVFGAMPESRVWASAFFTAVYTAVCAPYLHWVLFRMRGWTGVRPAARF